MATEDGGAKDPTARRRRIAERGSDRLALITGRVANAPPPPSPTAAQSHHSYTSSCPPNLTRLSDQLTSSDDNREVKAETAANNPGTKVQPVLRKSEANKFEPFEPSKEPSFEPNEKKYSPKKSTFKKIPKPDPKTPPKPDPKPTPKTDPKPPQKPDLKTYLLKTVGPSQFRSAILASQDMRRKGSLIAGMIALMSYLGFPILGSYIIRSVILSRPLLLLLLINITIAIGPLVLDATKTIAHEANAGSSTGESDFADHLSLALESGMLLKTSLSSFFMDVCIYSVVVVCGMSFLQKFGL